MTCEKIDAERERLTQIVMHKIDTMIACQEELTGSMHLSLVDLRLALSSSDPVIDIGLIRLYARFLSSTYGPATIRNTLMGVSRCAGVAFDQGWDLLPNSAYEAVTRAHMNAYLSASQRFKKNSETMMLARVAAGYPDNIDQLVELVGRGITDEQKLIDAMRDIDFGDVSALQEGAL